MMRAHAGDGCSTPLRCKYSEKYFLKNKTYRRRSLLTAASLTRALLRPSIVLGAPEKMKKKNNNKYYSVQNLRRNSVIYTYIIRLTDSYLRFQSRKLGRSEKTISAKHGHTTLTLCKSRCWMTSCIYFDGMMKTASNTALEILRPGLLNYNRYFFNIHVYIVLYKLEISNN